MLLLKVPDRGGGCSVSQRYTASADSAAPELSLEVIKLAVLLAVIPSRRHLRLAVAILGIRSEQPFVIGVPHSVRRVSFVTVKKQQRVNSGR